MDGDEGAEAPVPVEVVVPRGTGTLEVFLRVGADPRLYRVMPLRDPEQPRYWCLAVVACAPSGSPESADPLWAGAWGMAWGDVPVALAAIRGDAATWLAGNGQAGLRARLRERHPAPEPVSPPDPILPAPERSSTAETAATLDADRR
ncbi:MAG TPA: hypothetical protein VER37_00210 [Thermomicrobiales bacterium]|nr:hypothetical protein [Thermomicrobiales bacterium]